MESITTRRGLGSLTKESQFTTGDKLSEQLYILVCQLVSPHKPQKMKQKPLFLGLSAEHSSLLQVLSLPELP